MPKVEYILSIRDLFSGPLANAKAAVDGFDNKMNAAQRSANGLASTVKRLASGFLAFEGIKGIVETTAKMEGLNNAIKFASLDAKDAAANSRFLHDEIQRLHLPVFETMEGFQGLSAAMIGSNLQGAGARQIFDGVGTAISTLHLNAQSAGSIFLALSQMMSKGKVQAQELTLQLGQSLPGAQRLAAQAMGMTTAQFVKEMEKGNISAEKFLPRFASILKERFSSGLAVAANSLQSKLTDMKNGFVDLQLAFGETFYPLITKVIHGLTDLMAVIKIGVGWLKKHRDGVMFVVDALKWLVIGVAAYNTVAFVMNSYAAISATIMGVRMVAALTGATTAQIAFNAAANLNPYALLASSLAVLVIWMERYNSAQKAAVGKSIAESHAKNALTELKNVNQLADSYAKLHKVKNMDEARLKVIDQQLKIVGQYGKDGQSYQDLIALRNRITGGMGGSGDGAKAGGGGGITKTGIGSGIGEVSGKAPTTINITVNKLIEKQEIHTVNLREGTQAIKDQVTQALLTTLGDFNIALRDR